MFKEKVEKVIEAIQSKNKDMKVFPSLLDVCDPGDTNFKPKSFGETGYVLLCPFKVKQRERAIQAMEPTPSDYMGVSPFMMVVMESASKSCNAGDIVLVDHAMYSQIDRNFIIIKSAIAYLMPDSFIQGVEGDITKLVKEIEIIITVADV